MTLRLAALLLPLVGLSGLATAQTATPTPPAPEAKADLAPKVEPVSQVDKKDQEADSVRLKQASLESKIRPVSGHLFLKHGRLEITPGVALSLADSFFQKYAAGLKVDYHFNEAFSLGLYASYSYATPSGAVFKCGSSGACGAPTLNDLQQVPGKIGLMSGLEAGWTPLYGKVNLAAETVWHFDLGLTGGLGVLQYQVPEPRGTNALTLAGHLGLGQRFFLSRSTTVRLELRDYLYNGKIMQLGNSDTKLENQLMLELGISFFTGEPTRG